MLLPGSQASLINDMKRWLLALSNVRDSRNLRYGGKVMTITASIRFIRHRFEGVSPTTLQPFFNEGCFVLHYQDIESCQPEDYREKSARDAFRRLNEFLAQGGFMVADYTELMNGKMLIGQVDPCTPVEYQRVPSPTRQYIYKKIKMKHVKQVSVMHYPVLLSIRPQKGGIMISWDKYWGIVQAAYHGQALPANVRSLSDGQLEVLCYEYLRTTGKLACLMMPIGRTLAHVDVLGINNEGNRVAAQVTFETEAAKLEEKAQLLSQYAPELASGFFFSPMRPPTLLPDNIHWVGIEGVFAHFGPNHLLLAAMLNPKISP